MSDETDPLYDESFVVEGERKSSRRVLKALREAHDAFRDYQDDCDRIDDIYSMRVDWGRDWLDPDYDLMWASTEILKTAIYAKPPVPVVSPMFSDRRPLYNTTSEIVERVAISDFERSDLDLALIGVRDDLIFTNRGVLWARYEDGKLGQCVWGEHLDRKDFLHEPAREWAHVGWVARRAWMTKGEMRKRFRKHSGDMYQEAKFELLAEDRTNHTDDGIKKAGVWEVWHKADNKVYWVAEGCSDMLDHSDPYLDIKGFFPSPRPAYGTLARRSLIPVPDYRRYASILNQINKITARIYVLLDQVKMRGLYPGGGDIGGAIKTLMESQDDSILIEIPGASLIAGSSTGFVSWLPLDQVAGAITGLIEARTQLIQNYYELTGISDIMRGATEAEETLGAQQLKGQYGSVRVRQKIDEIQRLSRDFTRIVAEIAATKFSKESLLEMSMMELPTDAEIKKQIKEIEKSAREELEALTNAAREQAQQQPQQAPQQPPQPGQEQAPSPEQQFQEAQQAIVGKYSQQLDQAEQAVTIDAVMDLLRDDKARSLVFEVETDSTVLTDEMAEKASRNEFLQTVAGATSNLMQMATLGEQGAALAGGLLKFATAPYRVGRELNSLIDEFVEAAPQMAASMQQGDGAGEDMAALAEAEMEKAKVAGQKVQLDGQKAQMDLQQKQIAMQAEFQEKSAKLQQDQEKLRLQAQKQDQDFTAKMSDLDARINHLNAQTAKLLSDMGLDVRRQELEEYRVQTDTAFRAENEVRAAEGQVFEQQQQVAGNARADRGEERADRQQNFAETQAERDARLNRDRGQ